MTRILPILSIAFLVYFLQNSCTKDKTTNPIVNTNCDSVNITYTANIQPILKKYNCITCHGSSSPNLETLDKVKTTLESGNLLCSIEWTGCRNMPEGASVKIDSNEINAFKTWKCKGYPN